MSRLLPILVLFAAGPLVACIFERETYQGGGRIAHGATANPEGTDTAVATDTSNDNVDDGNGEVEDSGGALGLTDAAVD